MSLEQLEKLEELTQLAADRCQEAVERDRLRLELLDQQKHELSQINREYQHSVVGQSVVHPSLLAHRRSFVSKLTNKLDDLAEQREKEYETYLQGVAELQKKSAQHAAIETVCKRQSAERDQRLDKIEQQSMDDATRSLRHQCELNRERDHE